MFIFFLVVVLLTPTTMIVFGLLWQKNPPKAINSEYGYRTTWSMKSKKTWDFAHRYAGIIWVFTGIPLCIISIALLCILRGSDVDSLGGDVAIITIIQVLGFFLPVVPTEIALRKRFDKNGKV
jgi:uncharacterized membrane protein